MKSRILKYILIFIVITVINALLSHFAVLNYSIVPGITEVYFAVAFMIAFTLWFGLWGAIAAYLGCFIGAGLFDMLPLSINLYWSFADVWQVIIPLIAFRFLNADTGLTTKKDFLIFLIFGIVLNNAVGAAWGTIMYAAADVITWEHLSTAFLAWFIGNMIVTAIITTLLLKYVSPYIKKAGLTVNKNWFLD